MPGSATDRPLVVAAGLVGVDFAGVVGRLPEHDSSLELERISVQLGGSAAVACGTAAALGCSARLACRIANDFLGQFILGALREAGIEIRGAVDPDGQLSPFRFTVSGRDRGRTSFYTPGDAGGLDGGDVDIAHLLEDASALLIDGRSPRVHRLMAETARGQAMPVILNAGEVREGIGSIIALSDVLICSERVASELAPAEELSDSLAELTRLGPSAAIITLGSAGSIGLHGDRMVEQPTHPVEAVDSSGAGSVYHGAFAAAMLSNLPFEECMRFASTAAALSCTKRGPWAGIPSRREVEEAASEAA